jgi:DNA-binding XRE family transcriptional regulator
LESQRFNQKYHSYEEITNIPDRLRWCRYHKGLIQKEVADCVGISRIAYISMEKGELDCFNREIVDKLAEFYQIPVFDLLDDYNQFLYLGQGHMTKACREKLGMSQKEFAKFVGTPANSIYVWESEKKHLTKQSWEKYYKDKV